MKEINKIVHEVRQERMASNVCKCGHTLAEHIYKNGKEMMKCKKCRKCKGYKH